jgi:protein SCO1
LQIRSLVGITAVTGALLGILSGYFLYDAGPRDPNPQLTRGTVLFGQTRPLPKFSLVQSQNRAFSEQALRGLWSLLFVGYTHCPDVCPTTLSTLSEVVKTVGPPELRQRLQVVFLSVDPERDTPERLREYTTFFHPDFIGVTGERQQIDTLTNALGGVYHIAEHAEGDREYQVDHTSRIWLIDPRGHFHAVFGAPHEPALLAQELSIIAEAYATSGS